MKESKDDGVFKPTGARRLATCKPDQLPPAKARLREWNRRPIPSFGPVDVLRFELCAVTAPPAEQLLAFSQLLELLRVTLMTPVTTDDSRCDLEHRRDLIYTGMEQMLHRLRAIAISAGWSVTDCEAFNTVIAAESPSFEQWSSAIDLAKLLREQVMRDDTRDASSPPTLPAATPAEPPTTATPEWSAYMPLKEIGRILGYPPSSCKAREIERELIEIGSTLERRGKRKQYRVRLDTMTDETTRQAFLAQSKG
jgi:hypothetical protein